jgi:predicted DNA-binding antitoxin AbrB/MazE fold protein
MLHDPELQVDAVFKDGVFIPLGRVDLNEGQQVHLACSKIREIPNKNEVSCENPEMEFILPPPRSEGKLMATIKFRGRGKPIPVDWDDWSPSEDD